MEIVEFLQEMNANLDQFVWFRMLKFFLAFYLIIMFIATVLMIIQLVRKGYFTVISTGQEFPPIKKGSFLEPWKEVVSRVKSANVADWKIAVIESAELLDILLRTIKYPGNSLTERLEQMNQQQVPNLDELKEMVKVRNKVVQDAGYQLTQDEATKSVEAVGKTLQFFWAI